MLVDLNNATYTVYFHRTFSLTITVQCTYNQPILHYIPVSLLDFADITQDLLNCQIRYILLSYVTYTVLLCHWTDGIKLMKKNNKLHAVLHPLTKSTIQIEHDAK